MESGRSCDRHFSVPTEQTTGQRVEGDRRTTWTSDPGHDPGHDHRRRRSTSQRRYADAPATGVELQRLLPDQHASDDYRSAKEILDDCFSTSTTSATSSAAAATATNVNDAAYSTMNQESLHVQGSCMVDGISRSRRASSQERKVRSLVLDTRYNRLLLVKSKMTDAEALKRDVFRTNSLPSSRRRSRFQ